MLVRWSNGRFQPIDVQQHKLCTMMVKRVDFFGDHTIAPVVQREEELVDRMPSLAKHICLWHSNGFCAKCVQLEGELIRQLWSSEDSTSEQRRFIAFDVKLHQIDLRVLQVSHDSLQSLGDIAMAARSVLEVCF